MIKERLTNTTQHTTSTGNYASRLLSRVLNERKKVDSKLTTADAARFAADGSETKEKPVAASIKS